jgi:hypothetical protein
MDPGSRTSAPLLLDGAPQPDTSWLELLPYSAGGDELERSTTRHCRYCESLISKAHDGNFQLKIWKYYGYSHANPLTEEILRGADAGCPECALYMRVLKSFYRQDASEVYIVVAQSRLPADKARLNVRVQTRNYGKEGYLGGIEVRFFYSKGKFLKLSFQKVDEF